MRKSVATMEEFAAVAGLSRPTVSKYFNDPESVRRSTRERIEEALLRYDYRPNFLASNLNRKTTRILGILVPHLSDPFYTEFIRTVEDRACRQGYFTIALSSYGDRTQEKYAVESLLSMNVAGLIATPLGFASDPKVFERLRGEVPLVLVDSRVDMDDPFVGSDNAMGIELVVDYLLRTGETPLYFDMPNVNANSLERRAAYVRCMEREGLEPRVVADGSQNTEWYFERYGFENASRLIEDGQLSNTAILCASDRVAFGVLAAAFQAGLSVGRRGGSDLRVAGHDDQPLSEFTCPSLTTAAQDVSGMADAAVTIVLNRARGAREDQPQERILDARLMLRQSA